MWSCLEKCYHKYIRSKKSASLHNSYSYNAENKYYNIIKCKKKCSDVYKEFYKDITNRAKSRETQTEGNAQTKQCIKSN